VVEIPWGYAGLIRARSSSTLKGLDIHGTIDSGYRGEIFLLTNNLTDSPIEIKAGERIAQLVVVPCLVETIELVDELPDSQRGIGGFGSTGR
jgi:dUTP pyrophosphatase